MRRLALVALAACAPAPAAELVSGDVVLVREVIKGDELVVDKGGRTARVRLLGVHAFEAVIDDAALRGLAQAGIDRARELALGKRPTVALAAHAKDAHGRWLAYLADGGADIGRQLVADGLAIVYTEYPFEREAEYLAAEAAARDAHVHAWGDVTSTKMIRGLRREWAEARVQRTGKAPADPLLTVTE